MLNLGVFGAVLIWECLCGFALALMLLQEQYGFHIAFVAETAEWGLGADLGL